MILELKGVTPKEPGARALPEWREQRMRTNAQDSNVIRMNRCCEKLTPRLSLRSLGEYRRR
ncbi:MAG: hypothetical protein EA376_04345 [Phycisphaeraceae bacterium]|nr:MAG: hypothetical protein EA376_04345 [Phycisphaeraceae bacterium]